MPISPQRVGSTAPKTGTFQYGAKRLAGIPLKIPGAAGVSSVSNRRIVSLQVDASNVLYAVVSPVALASHTIVGWGVLEEALQSNGVNSIAPTPNNFEDGDTVVVLRDPNEVYMIDVDPSHVPTEGINTAYLDVQGRLSSVSGGSNLALLGSVFSATPGNQLSGQLAEDTKFYQLYTALKP